MKIKLTSLQSLDLRRFQSPQLFTSENIDSLEGASIPASWIKAVKSDSVQKALERIWGNSDVGKKFQSTFDEIDGIAILTCDNLPPFLLYWWRDGKDIRAYEGQLPLKEKNIPESLKSFYEKLPDDFKQIYRIHNGLEMMGDGILSVQDWKWDLGKDWDPSVGVHYKLNLNDLLQIYQHRSGIVLCLDREYNTVYFDWKNPKEPKFDVNFWVQLHDFMEMDFIERKPYEEPTSEEDTDPESNDFISQGIYKSVSDLDFPFIVRISKFELAIAIFLLIVFGFGLMAAGAGLIILDNFTYSITIIISIVLFLIGISVSYIYLFTYPVKIIFDKDKLKKFFFIGKKEVDAKEISNITYSHRPNSDMFLKVSTGTEESVVEIDQKNTDHSVVELSDKLHSLYHYYRSGKNGKL